MAVMAMADPTPARPQARQSSPPLGLRGFLEARLPWTTTAPLARHAGMEPGLRQYVNGAWRPGGQIFWVRVSVSGRVGQVVVSMMISLLLPFFFVRLGCVFL